MLSYLCPRDFYSFSFFLWIPQSTHSRWFIAMRSSNVLSPHIAYLISLDEKLQSSHISSESQTISEISDSLSSKSRISPHYRGFFMEKKTRENCTKSFDFVGKKDILILRTDHPPEKISTTRRSCEVSRDDSWSSGRRDTIRLYRQICRPYSSHLMSQKTHGQKIRRKKDLARRRRETWSVMAWNTNARDPRANSGRDSILLSFSFLVLFFIISIIIIAIYGLIA